MVRPLNPNLFPHFDTEYKYIIDRARELHNNAFRFSLDFGRLCPQKGVFDETLMGEYIRQLAWCHYRKIQPVLTIHHWPLPKSFTKYDNEGQIIEGGEVWTSVSQHLLNPTAKSAESLTALQVRTHRQFEYENQLNKPNIHRLSPRHQRWWKQKS